MSAAVTFSIIIVHWNTLDLTRQCIQSVYDKNQRTDFEIILIDNASTDASGFLLRDEFPGVIFRRSEENLGFAAANNRGIVLASGEYIILLNSDARMESAEPLAHVLRRFKADQTLGILGGALYFPNGRLQASGRPFLTLDRLIKQQIFFAGTCPLPERAREHLFAVDYVDGAFLCISRRVIEKISLFNERYTMYAEDMEWCRRAWSAGFRVVVDPTIQIIHHRGGSSTKRFSEILYINALNNCRFLDDTQSTSHAKIGYDIFLLGMLLRIPVALCRRTGLARDYWTGFRTSFRKRHQLKELL